MSGIARRAAARISTPVDVRHADVGEHDVRPQLADAVEPRLAAVREVRRESFVAQQDVERIENARLVVDDEHAWA